MAVVNDIVARALKKIGVLASGETIPAAEAADGLADLNSMLQSWNTDRLSIFTISIAAYPLTAGVPTYTIGPSGTFNAPRPQQIQNANIILTYLNPVVRVPLSLLTDAQWAAIKVQQIPNTIPQYLYNDGSYPLSNISLWGYPSLNQSLELYTWQALSTFTNLTDPVAFPPGYEEAIIYNLAVRLAPSYGVQVDPSVSTMAIISYSNLRALNTPETLMVCDQAVMGSGQKTAYNYMTGEPY